MNRKDLITVGSYVHICNRGAKKMQIYRQKSDLSRLVAGLFYFNSTYLPVNWTRDVEAEGGLHKLIWPKSWGDREPLVAILGYAIMPNHFHLILKEIRDGGVSAFMHKFSMGYSKYINARYDESGSLFQGRFKAKIIEDNTYLRHLAAYVLVKNPFEIYPSGGLIGAAEHFTDAYEWAIQYPLCSLAEYVGRHTSPILTKDVFSELFTEPNEFKVFAEDYIKGRHAKGVVLDL